MSETSAPYVTAAVEAVHAEQRQVKGIADWLLGTIHDMNYPPMPEHVWRAALAQVGERLREAVNG